MAPCTGAAADFSASLRIEGPGSLPWVWCMPLPGGASETASTSPLRCASAMSLCGFLTEADVVGDGGGFGPSSTSTLSFRLSGSSERAEFLFERPLAADLTLCVSVRSSPDTSPKPDVDPRGLSADLLPGILVRSEFLNERIDSLVSDLLNEGYESSAGPGPVGVCEPEVLLPSFDGWLPILSEWRSYRSASSSFLSKLFVV